MLLIVNELRIRIQSDPNNMFESGSGSDQDLNPMQLWFQKVQSYSDKNSASDKNTVNWLTYNSEMVKDIY